MVVALHALELVLALAVVVKQVDNTVRHGREFAAAESKARCCLDIQLTLPWPACPSKVVCALVRSPADAGDLLQRIRGRQHRLWELPELHGDVQAACPPARDELRLL